MRIIQTLVIAIIVAISTIAYAQPDYRISDSTYPGLPTITKSTLRPNQGFRVTGYVVNKGNQSASITSSTGAYLSNDAVFSSDDKFLGESYLGGVSPNNFSYYSISYILPTNTNAGNYFVIVFADNKKLVTESNEDNNYKVFPITVVAGAATYDLAIDKSAGNEPALDSTKIRPNQTTKTKVKFANIGNGTISSLFFEFRLSTDSVFSAGDVLLQSYSYTFVDSGQSYNLANVQLLIPASTVAGNYYVVGKADPGNLVAESNENNNHYAIPLQVVGTSATPDLAFDATAGFYTDTIDIGQYEQLKVYTKNIGEGYANYSYTHLYLSADTVLNKTTDLFLNSFYVGALSGNSSYTSNTGINLPTTIFPGKMYAFFVVDNNQNVVESNENNNIFRQTVIARGTPQFPDLTIEKTSTSPFLAADTFTLGTYFSTNFKVLNIGTVSCNYSYAGVYLSKDSVYDANDFLFSTPYIGGLVANGSYSTSVSGYFPSGLPTGKYYLLYKANVFKYVYENDTTNNTVYKVIYFKRPNGVDLTVEGTALTGLPKLGNADTIIAGQLDSLRYTIVNIGTATSQPVVTRVSLSPYSYQHSAEIVYLDSVPALQSGQRYTIKKQITIPATLAAGSIYAIFDANTTYGSSDNNSSNNMVYLQKQVKNNALGDVALSAQMLNGSATSIWPTTTVPGKTISVFLTANNMGSIGAPALNYIMYLSGNQTFEPTDEQVYSINMESIPVGGFLKSNFNFTLNSSVAPGNYYILLVADAENKFAETNEANNILALPLTINTPSPSVDLAFSSISTKVNLSANNVLPGYSGSLYGYITNLGNTPSPLTDITAYLSLDNKIDTSDRVIGSNTSSGFLNDQYFNIGLNIPANTPLNAYNLIVKVDANLNIDELNENNNTHILGLKVDTATDLIPTYLYLYTRQLLPGGSTGSNLNIFNNSAKTVAKARIEWFLSDDQDLSTNDILLARDSVTNITANNYRYLYPNLVMPANATAGLKYVIARTKVASGELERITQNNYIIDTVRILGGSFDFWAKSLSVNTSAATLNTNFSTSTNVLIAYSAPFTLQNVKVKYYLSKNATLDASDDLLDSLNLTFYTTTGTENTYSRTVSVPGSKLNAVGKYYIIAYVDGNQLYAETSENNNQVASSFYVNSGATTDLAIDQILLYNTEFAAKSTLPVSFRVINAGSSTINATTQVACYLSTDTLINGSDVQLVTYNQGSISAGGASTFSPNVSLPANTANGTYYLVAKADNLNAISETRENNNTAYKQITVVASKFDIVANTLTLSSNYNLYLGASKSYNYSFEFKPTATPDSFTVKVYLSDDTIATSSDLLLTTSRRYGPFTTNSLLYGSGTFNVPSGLVLGNQFLIIKLDADNEFSEENELNNTRYVPVTLLPGGIDFYNQVYISNYQNIYYKGDSVRYYAYQYSNGSEQHPKSTISYYISKDKEYNSGDIFLGVDSINVLSANSSSYTGQKKMALPANAPLGFVYLIAVSDVQNTSSEINENNNVSFQQLTIASKTGIADLHINNGNYFNQMGNLGSSVSLPVRIYNLGGSAATKSDIYVFLSDDSVYSASDIELYRSALGSIVKGITFDLSLPIQLPTTLTSGSKYLIARIDHAAQLTEQDETNNEVFFNFKLNKSELDVTADITTYSPSFVKQGDMVQFSSRVRNRGTIDATMFDSRLVLSADTAIDATDMVIEDYFVQNMGSGSSQGRNNSMKIALNQPAGVYYLIQSVDHTQKLTEVNEHNNKVVSVFTVLPADTTNKFIDLVAGALWLNKLVYAVGEPLETNITVANAGNKTAPVADLKFYLSTDPTYDATDKLLQSYNSSALVPGAVLNLNTSLYLTNLQAGTYYIIARTDGANLVTESNNSNNTIAVRFIIEGQPSAVKAEVNSQPSLTVYPNPATDVLNIAYENYNFNRLEIFDLAGRLVVARLLNASNSGNTAVNISELKKGIYIVRLIGNADMQVVKVVVE